VNATETDRLHATARTAAVDERADRTPLEDLESKHNT